MTYCSNLADCLAGADPDVSAVVCIRINPGMPDVEYGPFIADGTCEEARVEETHRCERCEGNPRVIELASAFLASEVRQLDNAAGTACPCAPQNENDKYGDNNDDAYYGPDCSQVHAPD